MSRKLIVAGTLCAAFTVTVFISYARSRSARSHAAKSQGLVQNISPADLAPGPDTRNLSLQPEAFELNRRVGGERFRSKTPATVVMQGVLTIGADRQNVVIRRSQNNGGESVEVVVAGAPAAFSWDETSGPRAATGPLDTNNRALLERLTFDSADEFILAQLRGASYTVVARDVRPDNAPEDYSSALWDVVRVDDPEQDQQKKPLSAWRLYYINTRTGLIDRVISDSQGDRVEATFSDWTDQHGEKFPSTITWISHGQTLLTQGRVISDPRSIIAAHEVLGHALGMITGQGGSETRAREVENEIRRGRGLEERDVLQSSPKGGPF